MTTFKSKLCRTCGLEKFLETGFYIRRSCRDGYSLDCRQCINESLRKRLETDEEYRNRRAEHRKKEKTSTAYKSRNRGERGAKWRKENPDRYRELKREKRRELRRLVIEKYGGKCVCCGETEPKFLTLDHVNNDGAAHRRVIRKANIHYWIIKNDYPDNIQIMCWNCNSGRALNNGICPHKLI